MDYGGRPRPRPHCVRWGPSSTLPKRAKSTILAHVYYGQTARWIRISLGMEVGLVLDGDPAILPTPKKGQSPPPMFGPCLLWSNGWMDQDATCTDYEGRPRPRPHCVRWGPSFPPRKGHSSPRSFSAHV